MRQFITCPRCGEQFEAEAEGYRPEHVCPMCGAAMSQFPSDTSVASDTNFDFVADEASLQRQRAAKFAQKTLGPMIGLTALAGLTLIAGLKQCILVYYGRANGMVDPAVADAAAQGRNIGIALSTFGITAAAAIILAGGICLHWRRYYALALAGCILASIPCISPCVIAGMPFGIWGLVLLSNRDLRQTFH